MDFFDGIEMEKSDLIEHYKDIINTVHRNIVVRSSEFFRKATKTTSMQTELAGAPRLSKISINNELVTSNQASVWYSVN